MFERSYVMAVSYLTGRRCPMNLFDIHAIDGVLEVFFELSHTVASRLLSLGLKGLVESVTQQ